MDGLKTKNPKSGFTLIEVMLVLAIAGVVLATVLISISQLQKNQRNEARRDDVIRLLSHINDSRKHTNGMFGATCNNTDSGCIVRDVELVHYDNLSNSSALISFVNNSTSYQDSSGSQLDPSGQTGLGSLNIQTYAVCNGSQLTGAGAQPQNVAIQYALEQGNTTNELFCQYL